MTQRRVLIPALAVAVFVTAGCGPSREERIAAQRETIDRFCVDCHNDLEQEADLSLESVELASVDAHRSTWERVVRKLRAGMMPPSDGGPRPASETYDELTSFIEGELDRTHELVVPPPGLHRLNRVEYANAVDELLGVDMEPGEYLPPDDSSNGFDNQAGTLSLSPALLEAYLTTAGKVTRLALGTATTPTQTVYRVSDDRTQNYRVEGLPFGTRGGTSVEHHFPADGEYNLKIFAVNLGNMGNFRPFGDIDGERLVVLVDGKRVGTFDWDEELGGGSGGQLQTLDVRVPVTAGAHEIGVTFVATNYAPVLDMNDKFERSTIETGGLPGFTFYPHVGRVRIEGPYDAERPSRSSSRERIFVCHPDEGADEAACARRIVERLARRGYRGQVEPADVETLMSFYGEARAEGGFEAGIEAAIQRLLTDPKFLFRTEEAPGDTRPGDVYEISDLELASRLSFFLWSSIPDDELLSVAEAGRLSEPDVLREQVLRMLEDPRSEAFTKNFAGQWLGLRNLEGHQPVVDLFPDFDDNLREAFRRETELLFDSLIRENRSVVELLTADYTFVNGRLAEHYGIDDVKGTRFRRVELGPEHEVRRGLLGNGSVLTVASQPVRTSPVIRGYWVLQNLLGMTPPPPPPDVPELEAGENDAAGNAEEPTLREQLEAHRADPACAGCHKLMDPIGFALEPFDATGKFRTEDNGKPIDPTGVMYDGTPIEGVADLREFLLEYKPRYVRNVTERLLTYALGRGVEHYDMPVVRDIVDEAAAHDYRFQELILAVIESEPFRSNMKPEDEDRVAALDAAGGPDARSVERTRGTGSAEAASRESE